MGPRRCHNDPWIVEKSAQEHSNHSPASSYRLRRGNPREDEVVGAIAQSREGEEVRRRDNVGAHDDARMVCREPFDDLRKRSCWRSDDGRIQPSIRRLWDRSETRCSLIPLLRFIECRPAAREERAGVDGGSTPRELRSKQSCTQGMLEVGNDLRYRRMGNTQLRRSLAEASGPHDREEHPQIAQPQSTSDVVVPIRYLGHKRSLSTLKLNRRYRL